MHPSTSTTSAAVRRGLAVAVLAVATAAPALAAGSSASAATATAGRTSRIASTAVHTCLDTSTTDPAHSFLDTYGRPCSGTASQSFTFTAVVGAPAGTFQVGTSTAGQCVVKYRFGLRQAACPATPSASYDEWTLQPVGTTGHDYRLLLTSTVVSSTPGCVQVDPKPAGYPGTLFSVHACTGAANQVLTMAARLA